MTIIWWMVSEIWSMTEFLVILDHFLRFYPSYNPENQNFEKWKKLLDILSFYISVPKIMIIGNTVPEIQHVTDVIFIFHFGLFFALLSPPNNPKNQNFEKKKKCKICLEISSFYTCVPKIMMTWCMVPEIWCTMDRRADGQMEKVTYRGGCPGLHLDKNSIQLSGPPLFYKNYTKLYFDSKHK